MENLRKVRKIKNIDIWRIWEKYKIKKGSDKVLDDMTAFDFDEEDNDAYSDNAFLNVAGGNTKESKEKKKDGIKT